MKRSLHSNALLLFLLILISISKISTRTIATQKGQETVKLNEINTSGGPDLVKLESIEFMNLMGVEDCNKGDEECFQRRIVSEAHLDYIYTQHHKP